MTAAGLIALLSTYPPDAVVRVMDWQLEPQHIGWDDEFPTQIQIGAHYS